MDQPLVSVIMPAYNADQYIGEAIDSILNQTYIHFEFIILDDGSTDLTKKIIQSYKDSRIRFVQNKSNQGLVHTLNKGLSLAKGELIARMDADDWAYPQRLELQANYMIKNRNIGLCGASIEIWDGAKVSDIWNYPSLDSEIKVKLFYKCSFAHPTVMYRKSLFLEHDLSYKQKFFPAEDFELWTTMAPITTFYNFSQPLLKYRRSDKQISTSQKKEQENKTLEINWNQLLKLNIKDSIEYKSLHESFIQNHFPENLDQLKTLTKWLEKILLANQRTKIFNQQYFAKELAKRLWNICYFLNCKNFKAIKIYRNSSLSNYYSPPLIKFLNGLFKNHFDFRLPKNGI